MGIGSLLSYYIIMFREIKMKNQEEFLDKTEKGGNENDIREYSCLALRPSNIMIRMIAT